MIFLNTVQLPTSKLVCRVACITVSLSTSTKTVFWASAEALIHRDVPVLGPIHRDDGDGAPLQTGTLHAAAFRSVRGVNRAHLYLLDGHPCPPP